ncbi:putative ribose 5-phosphate isomerase a [Phaeomoniella chlamydospora]|uniref:Ribose-5-phosphate isomerase n=1 Tax=Phaeomoniella chlamydospora TaxID=158046 RepID=A0A0G2HG64_PHACM|nr:putative ribose 5-phosphate isomerase a [Phaeomoniella chlamydospora]
MATTTAAAVNMIEEAKRRAAIKAVQEHFPKDPRFVGIGSGTTIVYVVEAIASLGVDTSRICFVPTGYQSRQLIINAGLVPIQFDSLPENTVIDIAFDGADEVDDDLNCIKGGGACLFQEKLVAMRAKEFICVADYRKLQPRLLTKWPTIPIEVAPLAAREVQSRLKALGSPKPVIREGNMAKAGPLKTDQDFFIIDAPFPPLLTASDVAAGKDGSGRNGIWQVELLAQKIRGTHGVLEVGIFAGPTGPEARAAGVIGGEKPVACYFGMEDGSVTVRTAKPTVI